MTDLSAVQRHGALRVHGNRIVGGHGKPVQLRGMSLFWSQWIGKYYNHDAIRWLRDDWNCSIVRAAMGVEYGGYLDHPDREKKKVIAVVEAAIDLGIYVLIDWHDHNATHHTARSQEFFAEMARRFGEYPNVIYETFNEPLDGVSWSRELKPYHEAIVHAIRAHSPHNLIVCGTPTWSQKVDEASLDPLRFDNIAYALHFYAGTHKQSLRDAATTALKNGIALMVTECGTTEATGDGPIDLEETQRWFQFCDAHGISWCNWSLADKQEASAALKSGAGERGGWSDNLLTPSGHLIRQELRSRKA